MRAILSLLILFALTFNSFASSGATSGASSGAVSVDRAPASIAPGGEAQESVLENEIDRQADVVFKDFIASTGSRVPLTSLQKAKREAIYRMKQMHVLTDILKAAGPAPATTVLATELLTNFVLAPIATAFGRPAAAGVMITVPWGLVTGFGVFSFQVMRERFKISRELGGVSLRELDQLRALVVGYDIKHRVSSAIYQSITSDQAEFEVLSRGWAFETSKAPALTIAELEGLVRKSGAQGTDYLQAIYNEKLDPAFYSSLLLRFINESDVLTAQLVAVVRARIPEAAASTDPLALRRHLIGVDDVKTQLEREIRNTQTIKGGLKKRVKAGEISAGESKRLKAHAVVEIARLQEVKGRLMRHEYAVLLEARAAIAGDKASLHAVHVEAVRSADLVALALEARVQPPKAAIVGAALERRATTLEKIRAAVRKVSARDLVCSDLFL